MQRDLKDHMTTLTNRGNRVNAVTLHLAWCLKEIRSTLSGLENISLNTETLQRVNDKSLMYEHEKNVLSTIRSVDYLNNTRTLRQLILNGTSLRNSF